MEQILTDLRKSLIQSSEPFTEGAVAVFEQEFQSRRGAKLIITALGIYEAEVDGVKLGTQMFAPGYTYYPRDMYYQTYNLQDLPDGLHTLRVYLGQGWYCGRFTFENKVQIYGDLPAVAWVLKTEDQCYISTDSSVVELESPYDYAGFYDGEIYHEQTLRGIGKSPVHSNAELPEHISETTCAVRMREEMPVKQVIISGDTTILDFGQNFAGIICIDPSKMEGQMLRLRHGEILNADGSLYTANLRKAKAELVYYKGDDSKIYRPRFTYMGFRYAELTGVPYRNGLITAYAIYSDMDRTGVFQCDTPMVQRLYDNQLWGQKSNYIEVPTDCPQRDERMGYTGDGHVFAQTGAYNYDIRKFWGKFLKDIRFSQLDNTDGYVGGTIPAQGEEGIGFLSLLGWGNCVCILPEMLYWQYGDDSFLRAQYDSMKRFVECEIRKMGNQDLWLCPNLGDWLAMGRDLKFMALHNGPVSNAFIANDLRIMTWAAEYLGHHSESVRYAEQMKKTCAAYIDTFVNPDGTMKDHYQGAYIMALRFVIPKGAFWDKVFANLVSDIKANGMQTGFFATQHILPLLAENGQEKLAYDLLLSENCPGWMYQIKHGATTTWERWDAIRPDGSINESDMNGDNMVSFNHYAFGSVGEFYYRYILGIQPEKPGFKAVRIRPCFDERLGCVQGSYLSESGKINVSWHLKGNTPHLKIETPVDATIILPDDVEHSVKPGRYNFSC